MTSIDRRTVLTAALGLSIASAGESASAQESAQRGPTNGVGQMIMMGFWGADPKSAAARNIADLLHRGQIGGVIFFEDNFPSPAAARQLIKTFEEAAAPFKPLFAVDQEGGAVVRLKAARGFKPLPAAWSIAHTSPQAAEAVYERAAAEMHDLGLNVNFGPVVDLAINNRNTIIEGLGRSYGDDPATVIEYAKAFVLAHRRQGMLTSIKHYPGHGSAGADSHLTLPNITGVWRDEERRPFADMISRGLADMVMVGHLVHESITGSYPASLSRKAIQTTLREQMSYDGVVVSDDMQMGALRRFFPPDQAIQLGLDAGLDLFVYSNREHPDPQMPGRFHRLVKAALASGQIDLSRIKSSVMRISRLKENIKRVARAG